MSDISRSLLMSSTKARVDQEPQKKLTLQDLLQAVDLNEKRNEELASQDKDKDMNTTNILALDKEYYDLRHDLMNYSSLSPVIT